MRHGVREFPGHALRRHHRVLPGGDGAAHALKFEASACAHPVPGQTGPTSIGARPAPLNARRIETRLNEMSRGQHREPASGPSQRQLRVGEAVRHAVSELLAHGEVHDAVIETHLITVPEVRMSPDLRLATIYVMPLGGRDEAQVLAALDRNKRYVRGAIAKKVNLKFAPDVRFRIDERFGEAERIERLLRSPAVKRDLAGGSDGEH